MLVGFLFANLTSAQTSETVFINADGSISPPTTAISTIDKITYTFTDKLNSEIFVERDNIIIDGNNFILQGNGNGAGIYLYGRTNVTIQKIRIMNFSEGVRIDSCSSINLNENTITNNSYGMGMSYSSNNNVFGNNITANNVDGIGLFVSSDNVIADNEVSQNGFRGVTISASSNNIVYGNNVTNNEYGVSFSSYFSSVSNNSISFNNIIANDYGVWLDSSTNQNTIFDNSISNNNITETNIACVTLEFSSNNTFSGNKVSSKEGGFGFGVVTSSYNTIFGNHITNTGTAVGFAFSSNYNNVSGNNINSGNGVTFDTSSGNIISGNNFDTAISITLFSSSNNMFYHNNFCSSNKQIYDFSWNNQTFPPSLNIWDNGLPSGGNYWSDYSGSDLNGDGLGDSPYIIDGNNADNYPLINPLNFPFENSFTIIASETDYIIITVSNSTVSNFNFNQVMKQLGFSVSGASGTTGFCNITTPAELMSGDFTLYLDDIALLESIDYTQLYNGTHYLFSLTYTHSTHTINLFSTEVVPDFEAWLFLPLLMTATLLGLALRKKLKKQ